MNLLCRKWTCVCLLLLCLGITPCFSQTLFWDPDQTDNTFTGNTGNWATAGNWRNNGNTLNVNWANGNIASFQVYRGYVTLAVAETVDQLLFANNSGGYRIIGGGTITLNGGTDILVQSDSFSARVEDPLQMSALASTVDMQGNGILFLTNTITAANQNLTLSANGGDIIASGVIGLGTGIVTKSGTGTLTLSAANTYSGGTTISAGTVDVSNATGLGTGAVTLNGGTLLVDGVTIGNNITAATGTTLKGNGAARANGTITLAAGGAYTLSTTNLSDVLTLSNADNDITGGSAATSITVSGPGTVLMSGDATPSNNFLGNFNLNAGTLSVSADAVMGNVANDINFNGGTLATTGTYTMNAGRVMTFNAGGGTINVATGITTTSATAGQISGSGALTKAGAGTLTVTQNNNGTYTGDVIINDGAFIMDGANGTMTGATSFTVNAGGTLTLQDAAGLNNNRIGAVGITLQAATFNYLDTAAGSPAETVGALTVNAGDSVVHLQRNGGSSAQITFASLTQNPGATVNYTNTGGVLGNAGNNPRVIYTTAPTLVNGLINGGSYVNTADFAGYGANGVQTYGGARTAQVNTSVATDNPSVAAAQANLTANRTINSLRYTGNFSNNLGGFTLNVGTGGIMNNSNNPFTISNGTLTAGGAAAGDLYLNVTQNTGTISAVIADNGGAVGLVKAGAGTLVLSGATANTNSGTTYVNEGTVQLNKTAGVDAIAGSLNIGDGAGTDTLQLSAANQINNGSAVTVNRSGVFDLNGNNETIGSLTMEGAVTAGTNGLVQTGAGTLTLGSNVTLSANLQSLASASITGNLDLGAATRTFTINDNAGVARDMDISAIISNGGVTKSGAGTLTFSGASANTYVGTTTVNNGTLELNKTAGVVAINGNMTISTGGTLLLAANNQIVDTGNMTLAGGTFNTGGFTETLGTLTLTADSTIDLSGGASVITFSPTWTPGGNILNILNWTGLVQGGGTDEIFFGSSKLFTDAQLSTIHFQGYGPGATQLASGEIVPVIPETASIAGAIIMLTMGIAARCFRRENRPKSF